MATFFGERSNIIDMKFKEISLINKPFSLKGREFNGNSWCINELFCSKLDIANMNGLLKCNIIATPSSDDGYKNYAGFAFVNVDFNIDEYATIGSRIEKKIKILELVKMGMLKIANYENIDLKLIQDAYEECVKDKYRYEFYIKKNKLKSSPNKQYKVGFFCEWDIDFCNIYSMLYSKSEFIKKELFLSVEPALGEIAYCLEWKWLDNNLVEIWDTRDKEKSHIWSFQI